MLGINLFKINTHKTLARVYRFVTVTSWKNEVFRDLFILQNSGVLGFEEKCTEELLYEEVGILAGKFELDP